MDMSAIASAIARQFSAEMVTPPTGYTEPGTALWELPTAITSTPVAVVFPPEAEFSYAAFKRSGNLDFTVRFYLSDAPGLPRATGEMYAWAGVLLDRMESHFDLDLSPTVSHAVVNGIRFGKLDYQGQEYTGIEVGVRVHTEEAFTPGTQGGFSNGFDGGFLT